MDHTGGLFVGWCSDGWRWGRGTDGADEEESDMAVRRAKRVRGGGRAKKSGGQGRVKELRESFLSLT